MYKLTSKQKIKELVKLSVISNFKPLSFDSEPVISHQKLIRVNSWVTKELKIPYIRCKISIFQSIIAQRLFGISHLNLILG